MTKAKLNRIGYITAALTFAIATFFMIGYYQGWDGNYDNAGVLFIPIALTVNLSVIGYMLFSSGKHKVKGPFRSIYAMLLNIPYAIFCLWFALYLMGIFRVTIVNDTPNRITNIEVSGCDTISVNALDPGGTETIWIYIPRDCSVDISFQTINGTTKNDNMVGYLCSGMGMKSTYHFSGKSNPKF